MENKMLIPIHGNQVGLHQIFSQVVVFTCVILHLYSQLYTDQSFNSIVKSINIYL